MNNGKEKGKSSAELISEACDSSVRAFCALITVPMRISAKCLKIFAESVESACKDFEASGKSKD